jgi:hypothetical protein
MRDLESCSPRYSRCFTLFRYDPHPSILFWFYFLEAGAQQTAHGVAISVEGTQDPGGRSTDERQSLGS